MPVLSEQITDVDPRVSTEWRRFTMACCLAIREIPMARVTVTTAGRPSGMAATARATAPEGGVGEVGALDHLQHEHQADGDPGDHGQALAQPVELALQRRVAGLVAAEHLGHLAHLGGHAGAGDDHLGPAPHDAWCS